MVTLIYVCIIMGLGVGFGGFVLTTLVDLCCNNPVCDYDRLDTDMSYYTNLDRED